jgi:transposase InsO family protein
MPTYGSIEQFSGVPTEWDSYSERLEQYFEANDLGEIEPLETNRAAVTVRQGRRRAILLSVIGGSTYTVLRNLCLPAKPAEKSYKELLQLLKAHYSPKPSETVQRFKFNTRLRKPDESIAGYVSVLRQMAENCNYGNKLEEMLRDRLVCGVNDDRTQRLLLAEDQLTLDKAFKIACSQEAADRDVNLFKSKAETEVEVNKVVSTSVAPNRRRRERKCFRCGDTSHIADKCNHIHSTCHYCKKIGHIVKACMKKEKDGSAGSGTSTINVTSECSSNLTEASEVYTMKSSQPPINLSVKLNGVPVIFQLDTGAGVSVINHRDLREKLGNLTLKPCDITLKSYSNNVIKVLGEIDVLVDFEGQSCNLTLIVVDGHGPPLVGRSWLKKLQLPWSTLFSITSAPPSGTNAKQLQKILEENQSLFDAEPGLLKDFQAHLDMKENALPVFCKARPVPFAIKKKIEDELTRLEGAGIIQKVTHSDWAAPLVPVVKPSGKLRLCGDFKVTINKFAVLDRYPLPRIDELFTNLAGGKKFSKLDLSQAYHQIALDESSMKLVTVNTHCGLFQYKRLPFGVSSAVSIFQRTIENLLKGIPGVSVYLDDILVTGGSDEEHLQNLHKVLKQLSENGLKLAKDKCQFLLSSVDYLGFQITADGIQPMEEKVRAIREAPAPTNIQELRSFIGMVNYYARFQPNLSHNMAPLYALLKKGTRWTWNKEHASAFNYIRDKISKDTVLAHYAPDKPLVLSCDASPVGIGAVLQQRETDGSLRPISYVSRSLSTAERSYAQIEREALAIVFGTEKFRQYLLGRTFTLLTDHQPLVILFGDHAGIPQMASARIKRWALALAAYSYTVKYISSKENTCADYLSRSPIQRMTPNVHEESVLRVDTDFPDVPLTAKTVAAETARDPVLSKVMHLTQIGWPSSSPGDTYKPYFLRRTELSIEQGCVLWGNRVVIPYTLQSMLLLDLHTEHMGVVRMKAMARKYFWWPKMDQDIENQTKICLSCQENASMPATSPVASWNWPTGPWKRIHIDYAGPFMGSMFLIVVDAYSKWLEVCRVNQANSAATISHLRRIFTTFGIPEHVVSDNGTHFTSEEVEDFLHKNNVHHTRTPPGHPASNGMAERYVGYFKTQMKKMDRDKISLDHKIDRFLFAYRTTPHPATGETPCFLMMKRELRTRFSDIRPSLQKEREIKTYDANAKCRSRFSEGSKVFAKNLRPAGARWLPGTVVEVLQRSYMVQVGHAVVKRHEDQLRPRSETVGEQPRCDVQPKEQQPYLPVVPPESSVDPSSLPASTTCSNSSMEQTATEKATSTAETIPETGSAGTDSTSEQSRRYPLRDRRPPIRYGEQTIDK